MNNDEFRYFIVIKQIFIVVTEMFSSYFYLIFLDKIQLSMTII